MIFQRGNPMDYERWAADEGMESWDYAHVLPYFKRMENCLAGADVWRGGSGPLVLERGPANTPLFGAFFEAVQQAGHPLTDDVNGYRQEGFAPFDRNVHKGRRLSAARAYLHPVMSRKNLTVHTLSHVTGLRFSGTRVTGVDYLRGGRLKRTASAGEVILAGGAFNTPQLLQLAGIGNPDDLEAAGVRTRVALPGVGYNLQDHLEVYLQHASTQPVSIGPWLKHRYKPQIGYSGCSNVPASAPQPLRSGRIHPLNDEVEYPTSCSTSCPSRSVTTVPSRPPSTDTSCTWVRCIPTCAGGSRSNPPTRSRTRRSSSTTSPPRMTAANGSK